MTWSFSVERCFSSFMFIWFFFFKQKTAYEMRISDWSSDVCSSDLLAQGQSDAQFPRHALHQRARDADLGVEGRKGQIHLQLPLDEDAERRASDAQRLGIPDLRRAGAVEEGRPQGSPHAEARGAALSHPARLPRSDEHTSELQSLMRTSN